ncbi:protein of unknown function (Signal transduction response regulator, C-terminal effector 131-213) [Magnetospirillum sp. XM-1]|uniref:helix-turn-helix transcriptional regulator n=1 Tax=Magnetospirillum sp. XM-1 TaxID=1663591 RepID=UPI00073DF240|nr:helix-turn-helix transcriptional regulator [Magnetospirillum sp. XM-1]CUW39623.1 protein of unknown function (Signal transduction response regulator, C-terminal effector 131-213) [Magnetospirillum sp. XM-1]
MGGQINLRRVIELIDTLYEAPETPALWDGVLSGLSEVLGARAFCLSQVGPEGTRLCLDNLDRHVASAEDLTAWITDLVARGPVPLGVIQQDRRLAAPLGGTDGVLTIIGLVKHSDDPPFACEEAELFALLVPLMARAFRLHKIFAAKVSKLALPPRQREVLALGAKGLRSKEIAEQLGLSQRTVEHHFTEATKRLGARGRAQAIASALDQGLITGGTRQTTRKK